MLECIDSYELTEWKAFEKAFGPIGSEYRDETLAAIHEQIQMLCGMYGQVNYGDKNPVEFARVPRPADVFKPKDEDEQGVYDEEKLRQQADQLAALSREFD